MRNAQISKRTMKTNFSFSFLTSFGIVFLSISLLFLCFHSFFDPVEASKGYGLPVSKKVDNLQIEKIEAILPNLKLNQSDLEKIIQIYNNNNEYRTNENGLLWVSIAGARDGVFGITGLLLFIYNRKSVKYFLMSILFLPIADILISFLNNFYYIQYCSEDVGEIGRKTCIKEGEEIELIKNIGVTLFPHIFGAIAIFILLIMTLLESRKKNNNNNNNNNKED